MAKATPKKTYLNRQQIHDADDIEIREVDVPEWGGVVCVKGITGTERDEFEGSIVEDVQQGKKTVVKVVHKEMRAKLVVKSVVHGPGTPEAGQRMFDETDIGWISSKSAAALDRVFSAAQELAGISERDVEDLVKGFEKAEVEGTDASTSA